MTIMAPPREGRRGRESEPLINHTVRINPTDAPYLPDGEARRQYAGFSGHTDVLAVISVFDGARDQQWLVTTPLRAGGKHAAELHPHIDHEPGQRDVRRGLGKHALSARPRDDEPVARVVRVTDLHEGHKRVVDEQDAATVYAGEGITLAELMAGVRESQVTPQRVEYAEWGNGLIATNDKGTIVINTFIEPDVTVVASPDTELYHGAVRIRPELPPLE